jgi:hypothetical protein
MSKLMVIGIIAGTYLIEHVREGGRRRTYETVGSVSSKWMRMIRRSAVFVTGFVGDELGKVTGRCR